MRDNGCGYKSTDYVRTTNAWSRDMSTKLQAGVLCRVDGTASPRL
jgi:hypothetical protein